jgi:Zn-dependent protease
MDANSWAKGAGFAVAFIGGIVLHGFATSRVAMALGDRTPKLMGRSSLSIKRHMDPLGTLIVPAVFTLGAIFGNPYLPLFGWGKRHEFSPRGLRNPRRDVILVALSGPAVTLALAAIGGLIVRTATNPRVFSFGAGLALVSAFLTVIELLPMPGRDGGRVLQRFLSPAAAMKMEELIQYDVLFLLGIFFLERVVGGTIVGMADPICRLVSNAPCGLLAAL